MLDLRASVLMTANIVTTGSCPYEGVVQGKGDGGGEGEGD